MADHTSAMYTFCGAFFSELKASGVDHAVVSPGARSTPLVVSADRAGLRLWVQIDERSAGFFALGIARAARRPVALICTSGTAAANYLPAVIEANRSGVPLVVLTADRPPEARGWGSNQTIDQFHLYGTNPRWFADLPVASEGSPDAARRFAARAASVAAASPAGPVHLNFPLRSPLRPDEGVPLAFPAPEKTIATHAQAEPGRAEVGALVDAIADHERGVILVGAMNPGDVDSGDVLEVAARAGWPILAEPTSQLRVATPSTGAAVVSTTSYLVQDTGFSTVHQPDAIVLLGAPSPMRSVRSWLEDQAGRRVILIGNGPEWADESFAFTDVIRSDPGRLFAVLRDAVPRYEERVSWRRAWLDADEAAVGAIRAALIEADMFEGRVITALAGVLPDEASLYVGNSMSVRDLDLYWPRHDGPIDIYSNRGASGIDGMVSSALGVAAGTGRPVVLLLGDLSLLHDLSGLLAAVRLRIPLVVVVVNNNGGGLFSFMPIGNLGTAVRFDDLFHTPHGANLDAVVSGLGATHHTVESSTGLQGAVIAALDEVGPTVIEVPIDAAASVVRHLAVDRSVLQALSPRA